ncbi:MAG: GIY-YIG nuclease family protein [Deltaproteobacteria bacterium]|nr:GIY-YIG nuclease family protein [Deltaproteobacteria bacterium]
MKPFFLYILRCKDDSLYVGHTDDLERRVLQHETGELPCYTRERRPVALVYSCEFSTRDEALQRERQLKGWSRAKKNALIHSDFARLRKLSKARTKASKRSRRVIGVVCEAS